LRRERDADKTTRNDKRQMEHSHRVEHWYGVHRDSFTCKVAFAKVGRNGEFHKATSGVRYGFGESG